MWSYNHTDKWRSKFLKRDLHWGQPAQTPSAGRSPPSSNPGSAISMWGENQLFRYQSISNSTWKATNMQHRSPSPIHSLAQRVVNRHLRLINWQLIALASQDVIFLAKYPPDCTEMYFPGLTPTVTCGTADRLAGNKKHFLFWQETSAVKPI